MKLLVKEVLARRISVSIACVVVAVALEGRGAENKTARPVSLASFANTPLYFEANVGQSGETGQFIARGAGCSVRLASTGAEMVLGTAENQTALRSVRLELVGANAASKMTGRDEMPARANYLIGNEPSKWHTGVPLFSRVQVDEVYPGMQVVYYANQSAQLEYDFLLQAGAQPGQIRFHVEGADQVRVDAAGNLALKIGGEEIRQHKPVAYQDAGGVRREVSANYHLNADGTVGFVLGEFDHNLPLVIDPVLDFMTYMGGKKVDIGWAVALDGDQNVYVAGETLSIGLLTTNAIIFGNTNFTVYRGGNNSFGDAFVAKYDTSGALQFLTYLGGRTDDGALSIAFDSLNNAVWVTGFTDSTNFPLQNPIRSSLTGPNKNAKRIFPVDAFIVKLDPSGTNLLFSTFFGGENIDEGLGIAVDASGFVYVTGLTSSTNLPGILPSAFQPTNSGQFDAFITKLASAGDNVYTNVYTTFFGGTNLDYGLSIAADSQQDAWVTGLTFSTNFFTTNAIQLAYGFFPNGHTFTNLNTETNLNRRVSLHSDAFVTEISPDGSTVPFSTLLGGSNDDVGEHITIDMSDNVYVTGYTFSRDFPTNVLTVPTTNSVTVVTTNAGTMALETNTYGPDVFVFPNPSTNFSSHVFVTEFTNRALAYSTHFGGNFADQGLGVAVDNNGLIYVTGSIGSTNFYSTNIIVLTNSIDHAVTNHHQIEYPGFSVSNPIFVNLTSTNTAKLKRTGGNTNDVFVAVLAPGMGTFVQSITVGGPGEDDPNGIAVDPSGSAVYIVGATTSITNFATTNAPQTGFGGGKSNRRFSDAFVGKIQIVPSP
jgi:Beta-propeller repeat